MAIGPVDFQPIMSKVNDVARIQNEQQQRIIGHEQLQAETSVRQAEQNTKSVHSQDQANRVTISDKQKERSGGGQLKQNQESETHEEKKEQKNNKKASLPQERHIDIRL